jgi:hypothetical protein
VRGIKDRDWGPQRRKVKTMATPPKVKAKGKPKRSNSRRDPKRRTVANHVSISAPFPPPKRPFFSILDGATCYGRGKILEEFGRPLKEEKEGTQGDHEFGGEEGPFQNRPRGLLLQPGLDSDMDTLPYEDRGEEEKQEGGETI